MKKMFLQLLALLVLLLLGYYTYFYIGGLDTQNQIEQRALKIEQKDCYTWQDIEIIIFGEIQE